MASVVTFGSLQKAKKAPLLTKRYYATAPAAAAVNLVKTSTNLNETTSATAAGQSLTSLTQPQVPRNVTITIVDTTASITSGYVAVTGLDVSGKPVTEVFAITGAGLYTGYVPFAVITEPILLYSFVGVAGSGDETIQVGLGTKHGLPMGPQEELVAVFKELHAGTTGAVGTVDKTYGTVIPTSASNADHAQEWWYLTQLRESLS